MAMLAPAVAGATPGTEPPMAWFEPSVAGACGGDAELLLPGAAEGIGASPAAPMESLKMGAGAGTELLGPPGGIAMSLDWAGTPMPEPATFGGRAGTILPGGASPSMEGASMGDEGMMLPTAAEGLGGPDAPMPLLKPGARPGTKPLDPTAGRAISGEGACVPMPGMSGAGASTRLSGAVDGTAPSVVGAGMGDEVMALPEAAEGMGAGPDALVPVPMPVMAGAGASAELLEPAEGPAPEAADQGNDRGTGAKAVDIMEAGPDPLVAMSRSAIPGAGVSAELLKSAEGPVPEGASWGDAMGPAACGLDAGLAASAVAGAELLGLAEGPGSWLGGASRGDEMGPDTCRVGAGADALILVPMPVAAGAGVSAELL